ncbi:hypothetical protein KKB18_01410 [bacterium]|nr:hypothetical protein [bacterium]
MEDVHELKKYKGLNKIFQLKVVPSTDAIGDWLWNGADAMWTVQSKRYVFGIRVLANNLYELFVMKVLK